MKTKPPTADQMLDFVQREKAQVWFGVSGSRRWFCDTELVSCNGRTAREAIIAAMKSHAKK